MDQKHYSRRRRRRRHQSSILLLIILVVLLAGISVETAYIIRNLKSKKTRAIESEQDEQSIINLETDPETEIIIEKVIEPETEIRTEPEAIPEQTLETDETDKELFVYSTAISNMSLEEKVAQLFIVTPEALTGVDSVSIAGDYTRSSFQNYPVGGIVYFENNIQSESQFHEMACAMQVISMERLQLPVFLCTDEEGGSVNRITGRGVADVPYIPSMYEIGTTGNPREAYNIGATIGSYLKRMGINVDFAPVADIYSNPENTVIGTRAFGENSELVSKMVENEVLGMKSVNMKTTLKHFPGHGDTSADSHSGMAVSYKTLDELRTFELRPFKAGIDAGTDFIMLGHITFPNISNNGIPASLSKWCVTYLLRDELGYDGIVITDALNMGAISYYYSSGDAAVMAIQAGVDMLLMPTDFHSAYNAVLRAVQAGVISEKRIDASLNRIFRVKSEL